MADCFFFGFMRHEVKRTQFNRQDAIYSLGLFGLGGSLAERSNG